MMKNRFYPLSLLGLLLLSANAEGNPGPSKAAACAEDYSALLSHAKQKIERIKARYAQFRPGPVGYSVAAIRDSIRKRLQIWHKHEYPVIAWDDATPIKAYTLAADSLGKLNDEARALLPSIGEIQDEIIGVQGKPGLLELVETYPARYDKYIDETATMSAQIEALEEILAKGKLPRTHNIELELPVVDVKPNGELGITTRKEYFSSDVQLKIQIQKMKDEMKLRTGRHFFALNNLGNISVDQAIAVKKLETYMHEIRRQLSKNPDLKLTEEVQAIYDRMKGLYKDDGVTLKDELRLPYWAWNNLRWQQMRGELTAVMQKDLPKLQDEAQNSKILEFLKGLSEEERRALGIGKLADATTIWGRTKWGGALTYLVTGTSTLGLGGYGLSYPVQGVYEFFIGDRVARERCASLEDDFQFSACVQEYVQIKFPGKSTLEVFQSGKAFLDPDGTIKDKEVRDVVKDLIKRREDFLADLRYQQNSKEVLEEAIRKIMAEKDPGSEAYRMRVVETKDHKVFTYGLMGNENPQVRSMLENRFPMHFKVHKPLVQEILQAELDSEAQELLLIKLEKAGAVTMSGWLRDVLRDRARFLRDIEDEERRRLQLEEEERYKREEEERIRKEEEEAKRRAEEEARPKPNPHTR